MATRKQREYLTLLNNSRLAACTAVDVYNRVFHDYRDEASLIMMSNAWELLAKAILVKKKKSILVGTDPNYIITGETAVRRLRTNGYIEENQEQLIQQIISLRNIATHHILPKVPVEIMHHLLFFGCKFYRETMSEFFPTHSKGFPESFLALSFGELTTYASRVEKLVSRVRKSPSDKKLVWLLERGTAFDGTNYISERQFEKKYAGKRGVLRYLKLCDFLNRTDMVRIVPVQAPKNYSADITLRKGRAGDKSLPVVVQKTDVEKDYPYLTSDLAKEDGKNTNFIAKTISKKGMRGDPRFHQSIRSSKATTIQRYSVAALNKIREILRLDPSFNPYK